MGALILLLATFIWGTAFLAQKFGSESLGPFAVTCFRNILGGAFLFVCVLIRNRRQRDSATLHSSLLPLNSVIAGVLCGIPLFAAMAAQQIGISYTTPGISGFLTTNYMFFIPILAFAFYRRLPGPHVCGGIALAIAGTYLICLSSEPGSSVTPHSSLFTLRSVGIGELWTILCAFLFAVQMMVVDRYAKRCDVLVMSSSQLFTAAILSVPFLLLSSELSLLRNSSLFTLHSSLPIIYLGVFSSGIAYTLQNYGQARTPPAVAGVVLSMESVFAALSGYVVLGDRMTGGQFLGCVLVLVAAITTQIFDIILQKKRGPEPDEFRI